MQKRILVVDDDAMNLRRTALILVKHYEVVSVESGEAALYKLEKEKFDLILLDIAMPGMSGIETFEHMKDKNIETPVIFLTASGDEDDVMNAIRLGAVNYLKKPFMPNALLDRVEKELEQ
ncbi:MAG: response regulator [Lachnospiraceae bacterium]|nr:response regulator [uncultured Acetatifactor sp.]MCI8287134.1 response regulator [Lachnospiraceae bacterium]